MSLVKVVKRSGHPINTTVFVILSFLFIHFISAKVSNISGLSSEALWSTSVGFIGLGVLYLITAYSILAFRHYSIYLFITTNFITWAVLVMMLYLSQIDKVLLSLSFFYVLISFYFYLLWSEEIRLACYNPAFSENDLDQTPSFSVKVSLIQESKKFFGKLTNWDDNSCFILLDDSNQKIVGNVDFQIQYCEKTFNFKATVFSHYGDFKALGLKFKQDNKFIHESWQHFFEILHERGLNENFIH